MPVRKILFALLVVALSISALAQESEEAKVPDDVMEQVVFQIIANQIKPSSKPKTVYLSERLIKAKWLPAIRNVNFVVLTEVQVGTREEGVYLFSDVQRHEGEYAISFGFGNHCVAGGVTFRFGVTDGELDYLRPGGGWGSGCSSAQGEGTNER